ncbi:glycosyltransferase family 4 protein [Xanthomarina sp. F2636L]|uniref:glycosyltransferase family 4 protein n=1 Tax=Xanthomarina sp. F2636L TaxID=2996018 RepID=UPI00225DFD00|nr:glycosyltransferase family 4 protein [Xanthomarina sp. F2636L]MCX7549361.1 glycosyltransferase family 4 protein [Xanthomarina sp. F2636L]
MKNLLFISHDTTRTGAPMVLLYLLRWIQVHQPQVKADVIAIRGGNMEGDFKNVCHNFYNYQECIKTQPLTITQRILKKLKLFKLKDKKAVFINLMAANNYEVIYTNTVLSVPLGVEISKNSSNSKLIAHIHELQVIIKTLLPNLSNYLPNIDILIVPSKLVKQNLIARWNIQKEKVKVVYECAKVSEKDTVFNTQKNKKKFVVGASGMVHWRKGYDIFLLVANHINKHYPKADITFQWIGKLPKSIAPIIDEDIRKLQLENNVTFVGEVNNTAPYFNAFDVFLMTSREDPFPLVCIEVGLIGKPIISFDQAVGTNEILKEGGGFIVPYLDIVAMAEHVMVYYNESEIKDSHGAQNKKSFSKFTPELICPQLYEIIEKHLK